MSKEQLLSAGADARQLESLERRSEALGIAVNWQALYGFAMLAMQKRGQLTLDDITVAVKAIFGGTLAQVYGWFGGEEMVPHAQADKPRINWEAALKLIADIQGGAGIVVIIQDIVDVLGG